MTRPHSFFFFWFAAHAVQWDGQQTLASQGTEQRRTEPRDRKDEQREMPTKEIFPCAALPEAGKGGKGC